MCCHKPNWTCAINNNWISWLYTSQFSCVISCGKTSDNIT
jgi:hypothetical protein